MWQAVSKVGKREDIARRVKVRENVDPLFRREWADLSLKIPLDNLALIDECYASLAFVGASKGKPAKG